MINWLATYSLESAKIYKTSYQVRVSSSFLGRDTVSEKVNKTAHFVEGHVSSLPFKKL